MFSPIISACNYATNGAGMQLKVSNRAMDLGWRTKGILKWLQLHDSSRGPKLLG